MKNVQNARKKIAGNSQPENELINISQKQYCLINFNVQYRHFSFKINYLEYIFLFVKDPVCNKGYTNYISRHADCDFFNMNIQGTGILQLIPVSIDDFAKISAFKSVTYISKYKKF